MLMIQQGQTMPLEVSLPNYRIGRSGPPANWRMVTGQRRAPSVCRLRVGQTGRSNGYAQSVLTGDALIAVSVGNARALTTRAPRYRLKCVHSFGYGELADLPAHERAEREAEVQDRGGEGASQDAFGRRQHAGHANEDG